MDPVASLKAWVKRVIGETRYHKKYACSVISQAEDGTLDLRPDDESIRGDGLSGVPIRHGVPGIKVLVSQGARVQFGYENGDPSKRYAALFEDDPDTVIGVDFIPGGRSAPIARVGDRVDVFAGTPGVDIPIQLTLPGGVTFVGVIKGGFAAPILGVIGAGNARLKA